MERSRVKRGCSNTNLVQLLTFLKKDLLMKSTPHGLPKAALLLFVTIIVFLVSPITGNCQYFQLPGTFSYSINTRHNQVFDISPDGKIAIALTNDPVSFQPAFLITFDPILSTEFDHKSFGFGPIDVRMAQVGNKLRAVVPTCYRSTITARHRSRRTDAARAFSFEQSVLSGNRQKSPHKFYSP